LAAVETVPAVAVNGADVDPAATVTDAGVARTVLLSVMVTAAPPAGAADVSVTVQVALAPDAMEEGEQDSELTVGGAAVMETAVALELLL
jgi:hypothetical protein